MKGSKGCASGKKGGAGKTGGADVFQPKGTKIPAGYSKLGPGKKGPKK